MMSAVVLLAISQVLLGIALLCLARAFWLSRKPVKRVPQIVLNSIDPTTTAKQVQAALLQYKRSSGKDLGLS